MSRILYSLLFLATLFCVSYFVFEPTNLYYEIPWLDIPMHIFGGMGVGALASALALHNKKKVSLLQAMIFYVVIAASWEVYEYARGVMVYDEASDYFDTVFDFANGAIGIILAYVLVSKRHN